MKYIEIHKANRLEISEENLNRLKEFLTIEIEDAISSRQPLEALWRDLLRQYEGVPKNPARNFPIENAPNVEVTLGAIAADAIYAQAVDLITQSSPLITCRAVGAADDRYLVEAIKGIQRFSNWMAANELGVKLAGDDFLLDFTQLGTGAFYTPWVENRRKTRTSQILTAHPRTYCIPIEDVIIPGGTKGTVDDFPLISLRFWRSETDIMAMAKRNNWNTLGVQAAGAKDWVRTRREALGQHIEGMERKGRLYEIFDVYCHFDIDGDGIDEDLYVVWDRTSRNVLKVAYNPYDHRPINLQVYQRRAHMVFGIGVLQMVKPYEEELTELHNYQTLNVLLANARMWATKEGVVPKNFRVWPNKQVPLPNPKEDLIGIQLGDIYPSLPTLQAMIVQLAERRVGVNEVSNPRPAMAMGNRTPATTTLTMMQQVNKRFAPAFDAVREGHAAAVRHGLYRYQEKILAKDNKTIQHLINVLGVDDALRVISVLQDENFDEHVNVELTASSTSINKEADRQNAMLLVSILSQYYQRTLELVMIASNPQTPPAIVDVAKKIANSAGEIIDRTIRTFDQVRDPATFIIELEETIDQAAADAPKQAITQLLGALTQGGKQVGAPTQIGNA
jgi:hypothetical protein